MTPTEKISQLGSGTNSDVVLRLIGNPNHESESLIQLLSQGLRPYYGVVTTEPPEPLKSNKKECIVVWNGDQATMDMVHSASQNMTPIILVIESGGAADTMAERVECDDPTIQNDFGPNHRIYLIEQEHPDTLKSALAELGFL